MFNNSLSPADVVALGNNNGFADGSWIWLILIFFLFGGWGNGNGNVANQYTLASDFATLQRQIDTLGSDLKQSNVSIGNGISSLGYDQLSRMDGLNTTMLQSTNTIQNAINTCCCNNREGFANVNYNLASQVNGLSNAVQTGFCQTNFNAQSNTRDIVDSQNAGTQAILAKLSSMEVNAKDEKIAELTARNADLRLQASQVAQNNYLVSQLRPSPIPSYNVANPYYYYGGTTIA